MKKVKKSLKGMTLIEIIIAMTLLIVVATMLVSGAYSAVANMRAAQKVASKTATQAPYADNHKNADSDGTISININVVGGGKSNTFNVDAYHVKDVGNDTDNYVGNYRYFDYVEVTSPPVTTTPPVTT